MLRQEKVVQEQAAVERVATQRGSAVFGMRALCAAIVVIFAVTNANAQYFRVQPTMENTVTLRAKSLDTILLTKMAPFTVPALEDTMSLNYHEPMPDSLMPRSAVVIGQVTIIEEEGDVVVEKLEKFAREVGANWIVSFSEPRARLTADGWKYYRGSALLLRVLDPTLIAQSAVTPEYEATSHFQQFADALDWYETYTKHYGQR